MFIASVDAVWPSHFLMLSSPLPSIFPNIREFSNESSVHIRWLNYWSFSFSISPSNEYSGLIPKYLGLTGLITLQSKVLFGDIEAINWIFVISFVFFNLPIFLYVFQECFVPFLGISYIDNHVILFASSFCGLVAKLCLTLDDSMDCGLPGSSVYGVSQARIWRWITISFSRDLPHSGIELVSLASPALAGRFFTTVPPGKPVLSL